MSQHVYKIGDKVELLYDYTLNSKLRVKKGEVLTVYGLPTGDITCCCLSDGSAWNFHNNNIKPHTPIQDQPAKETPMSIFNIGDKIRLTVDQAPLLPGNALDILIKDGKVTSQQEWVIDKLKFWENSTKIELKDQPTQSTVVQENTPPKPLSNTRKIRRVKWEYKVLHHPHLADEAYEKYLNELGEAGWSLVPNYGGSLVFKRLKTLGKKDNQPVEKSQDKLENVSERSLDIVKILQLCISGNENIGSLVSKQLFMQIRRDLQITRDQAQNYLANNSLKFNMVYSSGYWAHIENFGKPISARTAEILLKMHQEGKDVFIESVKKKSVEVSDQPLDIVLILQEAYKTKISLICPHAGLLVKQMREEMGCTQKEMWEKLQSKNPRRFAAETPLWLEKVENNEFGLLWEFAFDFLKIYQEHKKEKWIISDLSKLIS